MKKEYTIDEKYALLDRAKDLGITINGKLATIGGAKHDFAIVTELETHMSCEFSWPAVERILDSGGKFKSV